MIDAGLEDARGRTTDLGYQYEAELRRDKREWKRYERYIKRAHEYKRGFDEDAYYVSGDEMPMFGNRGRSRKGHRKVIEEDDDEDPFFARSRHHRHPSRHHSRPRSNVRHAEYSGGYGQRAPMNHYEYEYVPTYQYEDIGQDHSGRHGGRHRGGGFGDHHKSGRRHPSPAEGHHHTSRHEHSRRHCSPFHDGHQKSGHDHRRRSPNPFFADYSEHEHRHGKRHPKQSHYQSGHGRGRRAHGMGSSPEDDEGLFDDEEDAPHRNYGGPYGGFAGGSYIPPRGHHHFEGFADGSHVPPPPYDGFAGGSYVPPRGHHHFEGFADGSHAPPPRGARGHRKHRSDQEGMPNGGAATADDRPIDHYATLGISPQSSEEEYVHYVLIVNVVLTYALGLKKLQRKCGFKRTLTCSWPRKA